MAAKSKKQKKQTKDKKDKQQVKQDKGKKGKRKQAIEIVEETRPTPVGSAGSPPAASEETAGGGKEVKDSVRVKAAVEQAPADVAQSVESKSRASEYVPVPEDAAEPSTGSGKFTDIEPIDVPIVSDGDVVTLKEVIAHLEAQRAVGEGAAREVSPVEAVQVPQEESLSEAPSADAAGTVPEAPLMAAPETVVEATAGAAPAAATPPSDATSRSVPGRTAELPKVPERAPEQPQGRSQTLIATLCAVALVLFLLLIVLFFK